MSVDRFFFELDEQYRPIMVTLHDLLVEDYQLTPKLRYGLPFYYKNSWICYLSPKKMGAVEFAFTRGNELPNASGLLESYGRKQVMSLMIQTVGEIPLESLGETLQEAILLDKTKPYQSKRR